MNIERIARKISQDHEASVVSDVGHVVLDLAGLIPGYGEVADVANAAWYAGEGKYLLAALSLISVIPTIGDAIGKGGKVANWLTKALPKSGPKVIEWAPKIADKIRDVIQVVSANKDLIDKVFDEAEKSEDFKKYMSKMRDEFNEFIENLSKTEEEAEES